MPSSDLEQCPEDIQGCVLGLLKDLGNLLDHATRSNDPLFTISSSLNEDLKKSLENASVVLSTYHDLRYTGYTSDGRFDAEEDAEEDSESDADAFLREASSLTDCLMDLLPTIEQCCRDSAEPRDGNTARGAKIGKKPNSE